MTTGMVIGRPTYMGGAVSRGGLLCFSGLSWVAVGGLLWLLWIAMVHGHGGDGFAPVWASNVCRGLRGGNPCPGSEIRLFFVFRDRRFCPGRRDKRLQGVSCRITSCGMRWNRWYYNVFESAGMALCIGFARAFVPVGVKGWLWAFRGKDFCPARLGKRLTLVPGQIRGIVVHGRGHAWHTGYASYKSLRQFVW